MQEPIPIINNNSSNRNSKMDEQPRRTSRPRKPPSYADFNVAIRPTTDQPTLQSPLLPASSPCKQAPIQSNAKSESKSDSLARVLVKFINSVNEDLGSQRLSHEEDKIASIASTAAKGTGEKTHRHTGAQ